MSGHDIASDVGPLVDRWFDELFNQGNLDVADEILAEDVTYHGPESIAPSDIEGPEAIKEYVELYQAAFPDIVYTVSHRQVTERGMVVSWSADGTHRSDLFGIEATGETVSVDGLNVFEIEDGEITAIRSSWDTLKLVQELDAVPPIGDSSD